MTITYPLAFPTHKRPRSIRWRQRTVVAVSKSPFTRQRQVQRHPGQWWEADVTLPPMTRADAEIWIATLLALNGPEGTMLMGDPAGVTSRGTAAASPGTPLVLGGGQTGSTFFFDGVPAGVGYMKAGDWLQIGSGSASRLHKLVANADSNVLGQVAADIWPRLREPPLDNTPVVVAGAQGVFALPIGAAADWSIDQAMIYGLSFSVEEVV